MRMMTFLAIALISSGAMADTGLTIEEHATLSMLAERVASLEGIKAPEEGAKQFDAFSEASMHFEVNETDEDGEVLIRAKADTGLRLFYAFDPLGHQVLRIGSTDREQIGVAQFLLESAEPNIVGVQAAYPEGEYLFVAITIDGEFRVGMADLTHNLVPAPQFSPQEQEVDIQDVLIQWPPVDGASGYIVEIENDDLEFNMTINVDAAVNQFRVPAVFLVAGESYEIGVASVTEEGNVSFAESEFSVR